MKKNLVLTGMMGVGKSTIGKRIAKKLKAKFIDVDELIVKREKSSIKDIFEENGESYFRKIEKKITLYELKKANAVIALGGGSFLDKAVRKEVKNTSISFWLDLHLNLLLTRLNNSKKRPLLNQQNLSETVNKIYLERKNIYNDADYKIICDSMNASQVTDKIIKLYENSRN